MLKYISKDRSFYKAIAAVAIPMGLQQLLLISVNAVDSMLMGNIGEAQMAAVAIANQIFFVFTLFNYGFCLAGAMMISQYWGKKDTDSIKTVMAMVLRYGFVLASCVCALLFIFPEFFIRIYNQDPAVIGFGVTYLRIVCFSYILYGISINLMQSYRSIERPKIVLVSNAISYSLNILLNYCLVFGAFGLPKMGIAGAALGTLIARIVEIGVMSIYARLIEKNIKLRFHDILKVDRALRSDFVKTMKPVMGHEIIWGCGMTMASIIMGQLATAAIAAYNVAYLFQQVACAMFTGLGNAAQVLIGKTIGAGKMEDVRTNTYTFMLISLIGGILACALILFGKGFVISMYSLSPETARIAYDMMNVVAMVAFFYSFETIILVGTLRGGGDAKTGLYVDIVVMWCIAIPLALLGAFVFHWPPVLVILCIKIDMPLKATAGMIVALRMKWVKNLTRDSSLPETATV